MNLIVKNICAFLALCLMAAGCGARADTQSEKPRVVATIFPLYDFAREIAGDNADVSMLLPPSAEIHHFEPSPRDILNIENCDVFIYVGGESDLWVLDVLNAVDTDDIKIVRLIDEEIDEHTRKQEHEHTGHDETETDQHLWTSPKNVVEIVETIAAALCETDKENAEYYMENAERYMLSINELDEKFTNIVADGSRQIIAFGDSFPFSHFARGYGLQYIAAYPGCADQTEPSASDIANVIDEINRQNIPVIFHTETSDGRVAEIISEATGAEVKLFHAVHNISSEELEGGESYLSLMNNNAAALEAALN